MTPYPENQPNKHNKVFQLSAISRTTKRSHPCCSFRIANSFEPVEKLANSGQHQQDIQVRDSNATMIEEA
jgi:hypothetical protein